MTSVAVWSTSVHMQSMCCVTLDKAWGYWSCLCIILRLLQGE